MKKLKDIPGLSYTVPGPDLQSVNSIRHPGSFEWEIFRDHYLVLDAGGTKVTGMVIDFRSILCQS